jgi:hypothetical protein
VGWCKFLFHVWVGIHTLGGVELPCHPLVYFLWVGEAPQAALG